jgi:serine/threonine protein phosphatase PrpC
MIFFKINKKWKSFGASVIGPAHVKTSTPNQDYWMSKHYRWGSVVVVSDGLGSKPHSDHGSMMACLSVVEAAKKYRNCKYNVDDMLNFISANWLEKIKPYSASDCAATCLFSIQIKDEILLGRLGDGMIVAHGRSNKDSFVLDDKKQDSFSNYTNSLGKDIEASEWESIKIKSSEYKAIVLCTDGVSDDIVGRYVFDFSESFVKEYSNVFFMNRTREIQKMLNHWPVPKHSDDKTIACLFKKEGWDE